MDDTRNLPSNPYPDLNFMRRDGGDIQRVKEALLHFLFVNLMLPTWLMSYFVMGYITLVLHMILLYVFFLVCYPLDLVCWDGLFFSRLGRESPPSLGT